MTYLSILDPAVRAALEAQGLTVRPTFRLPLPFPPAVCQCALRPPAVRKYGGERFCVACGTPVRVGGAAESIALGQDTGSTGAAEGAGTLGPAGAGSGIG